MTMIRRLVIATAALVVAATASAQAGTPAMHITSSAFAAGGVIPARYTCEGRDISPPLHWTGVPTGVRSLALIVDDPDAPGGLWVHWVVYNLPADINGLSAGASGTLPPEAEEGSNSWNQLGYGGPCPPRGTHHYRFTLFALDTRLNLDAPDKAGLLQAMQGHVLGRARLVATYSK